MARKSTTALALVPAASPDALAAPPPDLTEAEAGVWRAVVESKPADWFGEDSRPLLKEYVRAASMCDRLDARIKKLEQEEGSVSDVRLALDMRDKESRRLTSIGTKLRLTQQSRYAPQSANTANQRAAGKRPWHG